MSARLFMENLVSGARKSRQFELTPLAMTIYEFAMTFYDLTARLSSVASTGDRWRASPTTKRRIHLFSKKHKRCAALILTGAAVLGTAGPSLAAWQPTKPIEFIATAGPGGGTDIIARTIQTIIGKPKLLSQPVTVVNKAGCSGLDGYLYGNQFAGDDH